MVLAVLTPFPAPRHAQAKDLHRTKTETVFAAQVLRILDGDTFEVQIQLLPGLSQITHIRIRDFDAPELHAACATQREQAELARTMLTNVLSGQRILLTDIQIDKYGGRYDAILYLNDQRFDPIALGIPQKSPC